MNLDFAGDKLRIPGGLRPEGDGPVHQHDSFGPETCGSFHDLGRRPFRVERQLDQAVPIPQIDKYQSAEIPPAVYPPAKPNFLPELLAGQGAATMSTKRGCAHQECASASTSAE